MEGDKFTPPQSRVSTPAPTPTSDITPLLSNYHSTSSSSFNSNSNSPQTHLDNDVTLPQQKTFIHWINAQIKQSFLNNKSNSTELHTHPNNGVNISKNEPIPMVKDLNTDLRDGKILRILVNHLLNINIKEEKLHQQKQIHYNDDIHRTHHETDNDDDDNNDNNENNGHHHISNRIERMVNVEKVLNILKHHDAFRHSSIHTIGVADIVDGNLKVKKIVSLFLVHHYLHLLNTKTISAVILLFFSSFIIFTLWLLSVDYGINLDFNLYHKNRNYDKLNG